MVIILNSSKFIVMNVNSGSKKRKDVNSNCHTDSNKSQSCYDPEADAVIMFAIVVFLCFRYNKGGDAIIVPHHGDWYYSQVAQERRY